MSTALCNLKSHCFENLIELLPILPPYIYGMLVLIHERRLKFKPALFNQDGVVDRTNVKEVWFAGNHGDVGGGWKKEPDQLRQLPDTPLA